MPDRRVRQALRDALNGDADTVDAPVRRGLLVLAVAQDDADDRFDRIEQKFEKVAESVDALKRAVYGTAALITAAIVAIVGDVLPKV